MASDGYSLKDDLFNEITITRAAKRLKKVYEPFNMEEFINEALDGIKPLELKARMAYIAQLLKKYIDLDYLEALEVFRKSLEGEEESHFIYGSFQDYIMLNGCKDEYLEESLQAMGDLTQYFSAEFAIRPFINNYPEATMKAMEQWSKSDNYHQRRLASEGLRPKLPWAMGITLAYEEGASYLDNLFYDRERYVTRSVANHLNDISKLEPMFVVNRLKKWRESNKQEGKEMAYIISHSLRTLVKKGDLSALELLGYKSEPNIEVRPLKIKDKAINIGDSLEFEVEIKAKEEGNLMIDYEVTYPMASGKTSKKVFKLKKMAVIKEGTYTLSKKHPFRLMTTKKLYSGDYKIALQINGTMYPQTSFNLKV